MLLGFLGVLGGALEVPWGPLGVSWEVLGPPCRPWKRPWIVLGALGVILEVLGDPWISSGRLDFCYFIGFSWYFEMQCFSLFFR